MTQHPETQPTPRQPWLHELAVCVDGNTTALSGRDGQIDATGAQGVFVDDRRVVSGLHVQLGDEPSSYVASPWRATKTRAGQCRSLIVRRLGQPRPPVAVLVLRPSPRHARGRPDRRGPPQPRGRWRRPDRADPGHLTRRRAGHRAARRAGRRRRC